MVAKDKPESGAAKPRAANVMEFKVGFEGKPTQKLDVFAYAFDRQGNFLASAPVQADSVKLNIPADKARSARVFFAPRRPDRKDEKLFTLDMMERLHAYEAPWNIDIQKPVNELLPIPEYLWKWWLFCACRVRGQVVKPVVQNGINYDLPVCNARVHICEVDPFIWLIPRLPDPIVFRLRDELLQAIEKGWPPIPNPPDPPPFEYDPGVIDPSPINLARMNRAAQFEAASFS